MKKCVIFLGILMLGVVVWVGFIKPAMALLTDFDEDTSEDGTALARVTGRYVEIGKPYTREGHYGSIEEGNVYRAAYTRFWGKDQDGNTVYLDLFPLANYTDEDGYYVESVIFAETKTDSGYSNDENPALSIAEAKIGPPGVQ